LQQGSHAELEAQGGAYRDFIKLSYAPAVA
jgi:hypothetical protein